MRIAVIAHLRHPIGEPFAGGLEAHVYRLTRALVRRGHDVTLFASGDSDAALPLEAAIPHHYDAVFPWHRWHDTPTLHAWLDGIWPDIVDRVAAGSFDVVHNNGLHPAPIEWAERTCSAMLTTLHVPPFHTLHQAVDRARSAWCAFTVPSRLQGRSWWSELPDNARILANWIALDDWPFHHEGDGSAVWFGRIAANKGTALAVEAARRAGIALMLYGPIEDRQYFEHEVQPRLDNTRRYGGHLVGRVLAERVGRASVALFTPMWDEPFGLTAVEAMATGVPVAAFDRGAAREVVGACGEFAPPGDVDGLATALVRATQISRLKVRAEVAVRFDETVALPALEQAYTDVIAAASSARSSLTAAR